MNNNQPAPQNGDRPLTCDEFATYEAAHRVHSAKQWAKIVRLDATVKVLVAIDVATFIAVMLM